MNQIVIRELDDRSLQMLQARAQASNRTPEEEARALLLAGLVADPAVRVRDMDRIRAMTPQRLESDSTDAIRAIRDGQTEVPHD